MALARVIGMAQQLPGNDRCMIFTLPCGQDANAPLGARCAGHLITREARKEERHPCRSASHATDTAVLSRRDPSRQGRPRPPFLGAAHGSGLVSGRLWRCVAATDPGTGPQARTRTRQSRQRRRLNSAAAGTRTGGTGLRVLRDGVFVGPRAAAVTRLRQPAPGAGPDAGQAETWATLAGCGR